MNYGSHRSHGYKPVLGAEGEPGRGCRGLGGLLQYREQRGKLAVLQVSWRAVPAGQPWQLWCAVPDARPCRTLAGSLCRACSSLGGHLRSWGHGCRVTLSCARGDGVLMCLQSSGDRLPQHCEPLSLLHQPVGISCPSPPGTPGWVAERISCHSTFRAPSSCLTSSQELGWKQQVLCVTCLAVYVGGGNCGCPV